MAMLDPTASFLHRKCYLIACKARAAARVLQAAAQPRTESTESDGAGTSAQLLLAAASEASEDAARHVSGKRSEMTAGETCDSASSDARDVFLIASWCPALR